MWVLPKQLISACALDTEELTWDLQELSQTCEQSLLWRSKPSQSSTWLKRWRKDTWLQLLSGRILKPSHGNVVEEWISCQVDTPASPLVPQVKEKAKTTPDTSGRTLAGQLTLFDLDTVSLKTSRDTSVSDSEKSLKIWKAKVTEQRGEYSQRLKLAHRTREKESLSWQTATVSTGAHRQKDGSMVDKLDQQVKNWPTVATNDSQQAAIPNDIGRGKLRCEVLPIKGTRSWPTPDVAQAQKVSNRPNHGQLGLANHPEVHGYECTREKMVKSRKGVSKFGPQDQENHNTNGNRQEQQTEN